MGLFWANLQSQICAWELLCYIEIMLYDLIIIGGGAAGTAAAVYAARRGLKFVILTDFFGGEVSRSGEVWNYPGFPKITGIELAQKFRRHLEENRVEIKEGEKVETIIDIPQGLEVKTAFSIYQTKTVLVAAGAHPKKLDIPGEKELAGKGITYCATCDGPLFHGKEVAIIGGGNRALEAGLMMAQIAKNVSVININGEFSGEKTLADNLQNKKNVEVFSETETIEILGKDRVEAVKIKNKKTGALRQIPVQGVFIHIGVEPNSDFAPVDKNERGEIMVDKFGKTSNPKIWAAGDCVAFPYRQISVASGQGVSALLSMVEYLNLE
ncbi:MAG: alkyl hydroperoxide reductase subunit F [Candidatus Berkelbacteria bacterium Licking1014_7]|uniref:Alkyl hydroperoxide reductase subunit F n=1 Tax=Candidatus Berkelbacteria bacterium Licking1014_7 TaxID=2017147 RepID=A0A554LJI2_9BACT|nr:MAG: alkyl hydroperoxide reductase subunit F [Candidatus Berkelbacteria bacterium Licking1014_7]